MSVYRKEPALPGSLLKHRDFEVLCGCIVSVDKWQGKPGRGVKTKLFYGFGVIVSQQTKLPRAHFTLSQW